MNDTVKSISSTILVLFSLMLEIGGFSAAQEKAAPSSEQRQEVSPEVQDKDKDTPTVTNPAVFDEKNLEKLKEKQREYVEKHYPNYRIKGTGEEQDVMDGHRYSFFDLENEQEEHVMTVRFDIEEAYQAYMKKHQKEIKREAEKLIRQGIIRIE